MAAPRNDNVKEKSLDAATGLLDTQTFADISLAEIAAAAGVSKGTLYYYYKSKTDILFDLTNRYLDRQWDELIAWTENKDKDTSVHRLVKYVVERNTASAGMRLHLIHAAMLGDEALRAKLAELYDVSSASYTVQPLWREGAWQTFLLRDGGREAACRSLCRGSHTLCVAITHPEQNANGLEASGMDVLRILPWGMQSAFAKTRPGYDAETALFNAAAVLGEKLTACRLRQIADVVHYLDEQNGYERVVFVGRGRYCQRQEAPRYWRHSFRLTRCSKQIIISPRKRRLKQACCGCAICRIWQSWPAGCVHSPPKPRRAGRWPHIRPRLFRRAGKRTP